MDKPKLLIAIMIAFIVSLVCTSCQEECITPEEVSSDDSSIHFEKRSYDEALAIAQESLSMLDDAKTRSGQCRTIDLSNTQYVLSNRTRSGQDTLDTLLYIFNFADDAGFSIVSANKAMTGLLAVTEAGNYNENALKAYTGLNMFINMAKRYSMHEKGGLIPYCDTLLVLNSNIGPLINVTWGQQFPEGLYCPNTIAGCATTALLQITSYFEYPTQLQLTFAQADTSSVTLNWSDMKLHTCGGSYPCSFFCPATEQAHKNIGRLSRQCTKYSSSTFYINDNNTIPENSPLLFDYHTYNALSGAKTSTYLSGSRNALNQLGYSLTNTTGYSASAIRSYLKSHWLIYLSGTDYSSGNAVGHGWVIDGYNDQECHIYSHITAPPSIIVTHKHYNHINWGWYGYFNGYFYDGVFAIGNAHAYDNYKHYSDSADYSYNLQIFGVHL